MTNCKVIAVSNQKGGVGKTTTVTNLGVALALEGKRVCLVDADPQANLSLACGISQPEKLQISMHDILSMIMGEKELPDKANYIHRASDAHALDIIPSNINLSITEINLRDEMGGEQTLAELLNPLRDDYDYIIIDTNPYLVLLTINALAACNEVIIPVSPQLWSATGLTDLLQTITKIKRKINPKISIAGILITMGDERTRLFREAKELLEESYGDKMKIFSTHIPSTTKVGEANYSCKSIMEYDVNSKASLAYKQLAKEVLANG